MCKLCNTDRPPKVYAYTHKAFEQRNSFLKIVKDYIGENPCSICVDNLYAKKQNSKNPDIYIINKLLRNYISKQISIQYWGDHILKKKIKQIKQIKKKKKIPKDKNKVIAQNVEKYIAKHVHIYTKNIYYTFAKKINKSKQKLVKSFKTLEEAQKFKKEYLCQIQAT